MIRVLTFGPALLLASAAFLGGCTTLREYGFGGAPRVTCRDKAAQLEDRLLGPDQGFLAVVRPLPDADAKCKGAP